MAERELIEQLKALDAGATKGPWDVDTEYCPVERCKNYFIGAPISNGTEHGRWATLFDSVNSDHKLIETEYDEDGATSWDETARRNAALIVYLRNSVPAIIAMSEELEAVKAKAERLAEALEFYARKQNWHGSALYISAMERDLGDNARAALKAKDADNANG